MSPASQAAAGLSMWRPAFASDQFLGLATFARADTLSWYLFESPILKQKWRGPMPTRRSPT